MNRVLPKDYQKVEQRQINKRTVFLYRLRKSSQIGQNNRICVDFLKSIAQDMQSHSPS